MCRDFHPKINARGNSEARSVVEGKDGEPCHPPTVAWIKQDECCPQHYLLRIQRFSLSLTFSPLSSGRVLILQKKKGIIVQPLIPNKCG